MDYPGEGRGGGGILCNYHVCVYHLSSVRLGNWCVDADGVFLIALKEDCDAVFFFVNEPYVKQNSWLHYCLPASVS